MPNTREKLVDVLRRKPYGQCSYEEMADYLIANGVTFATDNNVGDKVEGVRSDAL